MTYATTCHNNTELQPRTPNTKSNFLEFLGCWRSMLSYSSVRDKVPSRRSSFLKRLHPVKGRKKSAAAAMTTTNIKHNTRVFSLTILLEEYLSLITLKPPKTSQNRFPVARLQLSRTSQEEAQREIPVCICHFVPWLAKLILPAQKQHHATLEAVIQVTHHERL